MTAFLVDTQALLWWFAGEPRLSPPARNTIADPANSILVSAATAWEIAIKVGIGKLTEAAVFADDMPKYLAEQDFTPLPITIEHAQGAGALPMHHKDPFDRMLIAQARIESLPIISNDRVFDRYGATRIW